MVLAEIIGQRIIDHQKRAIKNKGESRLLAPGLTLDIAKDIHAFLIGNEIKSFLVIDDGMIPDEEKSWIKPEALTSVRIGSFVAIACPGQMGKIQDSIRGTGGTIKSPAYSEEWPWIDNGDNYFRFKGNIDMSLVGLWTDESNIQQWLIEFCDVILIPESKGYPERKHLLFTRFFNEFSANYAPEISDMREKILFYFGFPKFETVTDIEDLQKLKKRVRNLYTKIIYRYRNEEGIRNTLHEQVLENDKYTDQEKGLYKKALDALFDGLGSSEVLDLGALAFSQIWGNNINYWMLLSVPILEELFDIQEKKPAELTVENIRCNRSYSDTEKGIIITFWGEQIEITGEYSLPPDYQNFEWMLLLKLRGKDIDSQVLNLRKGLFQFHVDTGSIKGMENHASMKTLTFLVQADNEKRAELKIKLHLCGSKRPAFAVMIPAFMFVNAKVNPDLEPDGSLTTDQSQKLIMFSHSDDEPIVQLIGDEKVYKVNRLEEGIYIAKDQFDPSTTSSDRLDLSCYFSSELVSMISLVSKDIQRGQFTLEDELRVQLTKGNREKTKELIKIFTGEFQEIYPRLGEVNNSSRKRSLLASIMDEEDGWHPILLNFLDEIDFQKITSEASYLRASGSISSSLKGFSVSQKVSSLLKDYQQSRSKIISLITRRESDLVQYDKDHPLYAQCPVFISNNQEEIEQDLIHYLFSYHAILEHIHSERTNLTWAEIFILVYLDCVVLNDGSILKYNFSLVGPWHPLVIAKRFMVEEILYKRAERELKGKFTFSNLTALLREISGFHWLPCLRHTNTTIDPMFVIPTSDPGWHLAISKNISKDIANTEFGSIDKLFNQLNVRLGLLVKVVQGSTEDLVPFGIKNFVRSFPSRRALGIKVVGKYCITNILDSVRQTFQDQEEDEFELEQLLPGGIHIANNEEDIPSENINDYNPPLFLYKEKSGSAVIDQLIPDITLIGENADIVLESNEDNMFLGLSRGSGAECIISEPTTWLSQGASHIPISNTQYRENEINSFDDISSSFLSCLSLVSNIINKNYVIINKTSIPEKLNTYWAVLSGTMIDPSILVNYVINSSDFEDPNRALWDYTVDITGRKNDCFILSSIPQSFKKSVDGFFDMQVANDFIKEIGAIGIAIGGEALKSGRHTLSIIGFVGSIRLFMGSGSGYQSIFRNTKTSIGFILPIDSFTSFFGDNKTLNISGTHTGKRADLLAIQLDIINEKLIIQFIAIESKYVSYTFSEASAINALSQAENTRELLYALIEKSKNIGGIPERLALLSIIKYGLRISSVTSKLGNQEYISLENKIISMILAGSYKYKSSKSSTVVISTERSLKGPAEHKFLPSGLWIRINNSNWPGINNTTSLLKVRSELEECVKLTLNEIVTPEPPIGNQPIHPTGPDEKKPPIGSQPIHPTGSTENEPVMKPETAEGEKKDRDLFALDKIFIGVDSSRSPIYLDPQSSKDPLDNLNIMITGSSGKGKTQFLKYLIYKIREQNKNVLILDFKNDFASDKEFVKIAGLETYYATFDGLPFNPLIPYPIRHPGTGEKYILPGQHISGIASVLKRTYKLGIQQEAALKKAINETFIAEGISCEGTTKYSENLIYPDFNSIGEILQNTNLQAYNRVDPLFTLGLFRADYKNESFHNLVNKSLILDFSQIPSMELSNTLAELVVLSAHSYLNAQPHSGQIRQFIVLDEASRVLDSEFMVRLVRECRAYGVGAILSSQYPSDYSGAVSSSLSTKIIHGNDKDTDRVKAITHLLGCDDRDEEIGALDRFEALVSNRHHNNVHISTMNYPISLIHNELKTKKRMTLDEVNNIEGLDFSKLPMKYLLGRLERYNLIKINENEIELISSF